MNEKRHKPSPGSTPLYGEPMKQTAIYMPRHMIDWLKSQDGTMSEVIRAMIEREWAAYQKKASGK